MKTISALGLILALCLAAAPPAPECDGAPVRWLGHDPALAAAREKGLPVLLYFRRDHCRYCELLVKNGFNRPDLACYIGRKFVPGLIDTGRAPELKQKYRVAGEPTVWFLEPDGKPIDCFIGYVPPEKLALILRFVGDGHYQRMSYAEFERQEGTGK